MEAIRLYTSHATRHAHSTAGLHCCHTFIAVLQSVGEAVSLQFFSQRSAIDAEDVGGAALIAFGVIEHGFEERLFDLAQDELVELPRLVAIQRREVGVQRFFAHRTQRHCARGGSHDRLLTSSRFFSRRHGLSDVVDINARSHAALRNEPSSCSSASKYARARSTCVCASSACITA